jgi:outer membrane beta-barrel protein
MRAEPLLFALVLAAPALAQVEELQNPGRVLAVQDRYFQLNHELVVGGGLLPGDAYYKGICAQLAYAYHFTDAIAWQVARGSYSYNLPTTLRKDLEKEFGIITSASQEVQWTVGTDLLFSPIYGKAALLNRIVFYSELYLVLGGTVIKTPDAFRPAVNFGAGGRIFTTRSVSLRLEISNNLVLGKKLFNVPAISLALGFNFGSEATE